MVNQIHREGRTQEVEVVAHQPELIDELHLVAPVVDKSLVEKERVRRVTQKKVTRAHRGRHVRTALGNGSGSTSF